VLAAVKAEPSVAAEDAASLDRHCARRRVDEAAGTKEGAPQGAEPRKVTDEKKKGEALAKPSERSRGSLMFTDRADGLPTTASRAL
jgi:hypothetical protein